VLRIESGSRAVLWPYDRAGAPVAGFDSIISGAGDLSPAALVELILVAHGDLFTYPLVPAAKAHELGFISAADRDVLISNAAEQNSAHMHAAMDRARRYRLGPSEVDALRNAMHDPPRFARLAAKSHLSCPLVEPAWAWQVDSVAAAVVSRVHRPERLRWLAQTMRRITTYVLERDMEQAWRKAFWLGRTVPDDGV
jgi:hypothetical protein